MQRNITKWARLNRRSYFVPGEMSFTFEQISFVTVDIAEQSLSLKSPREALRQINCGSSISIFSISSSSSGRRRRRPSRTKALERSHIRLFLLAFGASCPFPSTCEYIKQIQRELYDLPQRHTASQKILASLQKRNPALAVMLCTQQST